MPDPKIEAVHSLYLKIGEARLLYEAAEDEEAPEDTPAQRAPGVRFKQISHELGVANASSGGSRHEWRITHSHSPPARLTLKKDNVDKVVKVDNVGNVDKDNVDKVDKVKF